MAVGCLGGLCVVMGAGGGAPAGETVLRANEEGIPLLTTAKPSFEVAGRLYSMGIRGRVKT
ncbi:MAG TPA: hypothetical protein DCX02_05820 [Firmicutes bacterium]|nr:hypothetical protein [Bacillota bacterium]